MSSDTVLYAVLGSVGAWLVVELLFYILIHYFVSPKLQPLRAPPAYPTESTDIFRRILDGLDALDSYEFETFFRGYFKFANMEDIKRRNFTSFLAWVTFAKKFDDLDETELATVHEQEEEVYQRYNFRLEDGFNPKVEHCCMTYEEVPFIHRPLLLYIISGLIDGVGAVVYRSCGYRRMEYNGMEYWHHPGSRDNSDNTPMILFHGITLGWINYFALVRALGVNREVFLIDVDAIKMMSLVFEMPTPEKFCNLVRRILLRHKVHRVHVVGHSFGSITSGWFVRAFPQIITNLTLLDPVSLLLGLPDVAYSFLYREPTTFMEKVIHYVAATEITIAHVLRRHFWWYKNILWLEDLAPHIHIVVGLAGNDEVANASSVREYVLKMKDKREEEKRKLVLNGNEVLDASNTVGHVEVLFWEGYSHGQCTACGIAIGTIRDAIHNMEKTSKIV